MQSIKEILMERDGVSEEEATGLIRSVQDDIDTILASYGSYEEIEYLLMDELGLEMDYVMDLI